MRSICTHRWLDKTPLPASEVELRRVLDPAVLMPRRQPTGRRHDTSVTQDRSHDEVINN